MRLTLKPDDPRLTWQGAVSLEANDDWLRPWRIPHDTLDLFPPDTLRNAAAMSAGVRIAFHLPDEVHPDAEGYKALAEHFSRRLTNRFFTAP